MVSEEIQTIILMKKIAKVTTVDWDIVNACFKERILISPTPLNNQECRIDVYSYDDNGNFTLIRKGNKVFKQVTQKDKDLLYNSVYDAYKYYYNKIKQE